MLESSQAISTSKPPEGTKFINEMRSKAKEAKLKRVKSMNAYRARKSGIHKISNTITKLSILKLMGKTLKEKP